MRNSSMPVAGAFALVVVLLSTQYVWSFGCRPGLLPNGSVNNCSNCHLNPNGGGTRNPFGELVDEIAQGCSDFWSVDLAMLDTDGDGITNGEELGDPDGTWVSGDDDPGNPDDVSNPGVTPTEIDCGDEIDNDFDGDLDCDDAECADKDECAVLVEICDDGVDNDEDSLIDCSDPDCEGNAEACPMLGPVFIRGDGNADGNIDLSDAVFTLNFLFLGGSAPGCSASSNANGDGAVDLSDAVFTLNFLFLGGSPPPSPYPDCGEGATIDCEQYTPCA